MAGPNLSWRPRGTFTLEKLEFSIPAGIVRKLLIDYLRQNIGSVPEDAKIEHFEWSDDGQDGIDGVFHVVSPAARPPEVTE